LAQGKWEKPYDTNRARAQIGDPNTSDSDRATGDVVKEFIERDGAIKIGLARGLLNSRALARYIQVATHEKYSFESLVSAIRRYPIKASASRYQDAGRLITKLTLKNNIVAVTIKSSPEIPLILAKFSGEIDYGRGETFRVSSGAESISVVIDSKNLDKLIAAIPKEDLVRVLSNLSEIIVVLSDIALKTVGVAATITTELAINGVNIMYIMSYGPPHTMVFIVEEDDALNGYRGLHKLSHISI
jgi:aspartokinase